MSNNDNTVKNKVSTHIQNQLPEFIQSDHPVFSQFVKLYYQFLESSEITFSEVNNYIREETESVNFVLDENGDQIVLEDSNVKFDIGEIITGQTSGATAKVLVDDIDDNKRLFVTSQTRFIIGEIVSGATSNASGTLETYRPNPVSSIQQLLSYSNVDSTLYSFLDRFRDSFLEGIVDNVNTGVDKRKLVKNIRDLYVAKGTKKGHELFFRLLLNETPQVQFPTDNMLRVSDGIWSVRDIMRVLPVSGSATELIGQTITGQTSFATAIVTAAVSFREATKDVVELELDKATINGTFLENEIIFGTSIISDQVVSFRPYSIITGSTISNGGAYYTADQVVNIAAGGSNSASAKVQNVTRGVVDEIVIDDAGQNYKVGENLVLDNTGTDGVGAAAAISVVGGGIAPESGSLSAYGMTATDHITLEETSQPFYNDSYEGTKIVLETGTFGDAPGSNANESGEITDVRIIGRGAGYSKLPVVSSIATANGSGAKLVAASNSGVGAIASFEFTNQGLLYSSPPAITPFRHAILKDISGNFATGDPLTSHSGTVTSWDSARQLISLDTTANLVVGNTVTTSGASGKIANISIATGTAQVGTIANTAGNFLNSEGQLSEVNIRVQDSYYYQDYSYVIKVGQSINEWRDAIKSTVHPAGWAVFGEVEVVGRANAQINIQTVDSYSPELASTLRTIFTTVFGRRLGTVDDGTSLKATPKVGSDDLTSFPNTNRDTTLTRINTLAIGVVRTPSAQGPTLDLLPKYAFGIGPTTTEDIPHYPSISRTTNLDGINNQSFTIDQFRNIRIDQVSVRNAQGQGGFSQTGSNFDSNTLTFDDGETFTIPPEAFNTKINVPPPGEIQVSGSARTNAFDNNFITFDSGTETFDETGVTTLMSDTGFTFDSTSVKFDGSGGDAVPRDAGGNYGIDFADTSASFDSSINKFDNSINIPVFERFDSLSFKFDNTNKKFDIGV